MDITYVEKTGVPYCIHGIKSLRINTPRGIFRLRQGTDGGLYSEKHGGALIPDEIFTDVLEEEVRYEIGVGV